MVSLDPYGINSDDFMRVSNISHTCKYLASKIDIDLKDEMLLPALLQETGKFVIVDILAQEGKVAEFKNKVASGATLKKLKEKIVGMTTSEITAKIFKHWKLRIILFLRIEFVDDISKSWSFI